MPAGEALVTDGGTGACDDPCAQACRDRRCLYCKALDKWASYGAFNCSCRGSYKFPVPPQYTYHWPGMYSQQTITEYASPYRFPPLKDPPVEKAEVQPDQDAGPPSRETLRPIRQVSRQEPLAPEPLPTPSTSSDTVSGKIKRAYGLD